MREKERYLSGATRDRFAYRFLQPAHAALALVHR
jgi:hypothetical protein